jgi:gp6-like head-tail connector protein
MRYRASRCLSASFDALTLRCLRTIIHGAGDDGGPGHRADQPGEAKAYLRIDASDEDSLLTSLITAARMFVERTLSLALITESWSSISTAGRAAARSYCRSSRCRR